MKEGDMESLNTLECKNSKSQDAKFPANEEDKPKFCINIGRPVRRSTFCHIMPHEESSNTNGRKSTSEDIDLETDYQEPEKPFETDLKRSVNVPPARLRSCLKSKPQNFGEQKLLEFGSTDFSPRTQNNSRDNSFGQRETYMTYFGSEALVTPGPCTGASNYKTPGAEDSQSSHQSVRIDTQEATEEDAYLLPDVGSGYRVVTFSNTVADMYEQGSRKRLNNLSLSPHKKSPVVSQHLKSAIESLTGSANEVEKVIRVENYSELLENSVNSFVDDMQFNDENNLEKDFRLNQQLDSNYASNSIYFDMNIKSSESILENLDFTEKHLAQSKQSVNGLLDELNVLNDRLAQNPRLQRLESMIDVNEEQNPQYNLFETYDDEEEDFEDHREPAEKGDACYVHAVDEIEDDSLEKCRVELFQTPATYSPQDMYLRRDILSRMKRPGQHQYNNVQSMITTCVSEASEPGFDEDTGLNFHGIPVSPLHPDFRDSVVSTMKSVRAVREIIVKDLNKLKKLIKSSTPPPAQESEDMTTEATETGAAGNEEHEMDERIAYVQQIELELKEIDSCYKWVSGELLKESDKESETDEESAKLERKDFALETPCELFSDSEKSKLSLDQPENQVVKKMRFVTDEFFERRKDLLVKCKNVHDTLSQLSFYAMDSNSTIELNVVEIPEIDKSDLSDPSLVCLNQAGSLRHSLTGEHVTGPELLSGCDPEPLDKENGNLQANTVVEPKRRKSCIAAGYNKTSRIPVLKKLNKVKKYTANRKVNSFVLTPGSPRETPMFVQFDVQDQSSADEHVENRPHYPQSNFSTGDFDTRHVAITGPDKLKAVNESKQAGLENVQMCCKGPIRKTYKFCETILDSEDEETENKVLNRDEDGFLEVRMSAAESYLNNNDFNYRNEKLWKKNQIGIQELQEEKYMHTSAIYTPVTTRSEWREKVIRAMINNEENRDSEGESLKPSSEGHSIPDEACNIIAPVDSQETQTYQARVKTPGFFRLRWCINLLFYPCIRLYRSITDTD